MFEILFILGALGLLLGTCLEFLASLAAFPTLLTAAAAVPLLGWAIYLELLRGFGLAGLGRERPPVPPERFYWVLHRSRLRIALGCLLPLAAVAWAVAIRWPAELSYAGDSIAGWIGGAVAIVTSAVWCACATIYVRASQWFDKMAPWIVGVCRRSLYRWSENPEFLSEEPDGQREEEKTVY